MKKQSLAEWLHWIEQQHHTTIDLGLDRISRVYEKLGSPKLAEKVVTVAGTNGKGSTVTALAYMLGSMSLNVGVYTSPHLLKFNERISVNFNNIDDDSLVRAFETVYAALDDVHLSFFEFTTLAAFVHFSQQNLDFALLEVGLGGRLDAVNIIDPDLAIITSIALDHQHWLGDDLQSIAFEKAGILRENISFVCGETSVKDYLHELALERGCQCYIAGIDFDIEEMQNQIIWRSLGQDKNETSNKELSFTGAYLPLNSIAIALQSMQLLYPDFDLQTLEAPITQARLQGRYQRLKAQAGFDVIFDVAHNPASVALLNERLNKENKAGRVIAVFSALKDKDISSMLSAIHKQIDKWFIAEIKDNSRAQSQEILAEELSLFSKNVTLSSDLGDAYQQAYSMMNPEDILIVFGSFYVLAELLENETKLKLEKGVL